MRYLRPTFLLLALSTFAQVALAAGPRSPQQLTHDVASLPTSAPLHFAISPDGRQVVVSAFWQKGLALYLSSVAPQPGQAPQMIPNSEGQRGSGAGFPFWSPDGRNIAFFSSGQLKMIGLSGEGLETLCEAPQGHGGSWSRNGMIVLAPDAIGPLYQIPATGGIPQPVTQLDESRGEVAHRHPWFLPDGVHFLYLAVSRQPGMSAIWVGSIYSPERTFLLNADYKPAFAPPNFLLYVEGSTLMARLFDPQNLTLTGRPFRVVRQVGVNSLNNAAGFTTSESAALAYRRAGRIEITIVTDWTNPSDSEQQR